MKIENFRTQNFKDKVNHIMNERHCSVLSQYKNKKVQYNFTLKGETKPIRINGKSIEDCVAFYYIEDEKRITPQAITFTDIQQLNRDLTISEVVCGEMVTIKSTKKVIKKSEPKIKLKVGDRMWISEFYSDHDKLVEITNVTNRQAKYKYIHMFIPYNDNINRQDYDFNVNISDISFSNTFGNEYTLRINKDGNWQNGNSWIYSDNQNKKTLNIYHYSL